MDNINVNSPVILTNTEFASFEELAEIAVNWNLDFRQISSRRFNSKVFQAQTDLLLFSKVHFGCHVDQHGATPPGMKTFGIPTDKCPDFNWFGHKVNKDNLLIFPKSEEIQAFTKTGFEIFTLSIPEKYLLAFFEKNNIVQPKKILTAKETILQVPVTRLNEIRTLIFQLEQVIIKPFDLSNQHLYISAIQTTIMFCLLKILTNCPPSLKQINNRHAALLNISTEYIESNINEPILIQDICTLTKTSERTIQNIFKNEFGILPKSYIIGQKLYKVHNRLRQASPKDKQVKQIAYDTGFSHMGQFAADYFKLFNELPSDTLKQPVKD